MASRLIFLPFRLVHVPTTWVGYVVAWLAAGYRTATPFERALIFPSWAILRAVFIAGFAVSYVLHAGGRRLLAG